MALPLAYSLTDFRGGRFTRRTAAMLRWVEARASVGNLVIGQGGWRGSQSAAASGTTHLKDAVDLSVRNLTDKQKQRLLNTMKDAGFAAWIRTPIPGLWPEHLHAVPIPPSTSARVVARYLSPSAASQVLAYNAGRDGLTGNRPDHTYRPSPRVTFSYLRNTPVHR